ncbi:cobalt transporter [Sphingorhabdus soli]|uniref:Cobalt transporter n=1 Tax=Flavisphingopyxis soli TaxID=2601267 RepID=A0A5C6UM73_9SPHN|nr:cation transporter [Sphingorhabdus soli]TXC74117.1 cobalt transporter [Sphingorhabdus soli]
MTYDHLPQELRAPMHRAVRLEYWNIFWSTSVVIVMGLVMGQSQAMKTAWVEDLLALVPPIAFLVAARLESTADHSPRFPFGMRRANSLGFFVAAVSLFAIGALMLFESASTLLKQEHVTIGTIELFGQSIWLGWLMLGAQLYSLIPPIFIGNRELPLSNTLQDKLLHTDALMNKANWMTGAAGMAGVAGLGLGYWWADSLAAALISLDIVHDGFKAMKASSAELVDGAPRALDSDGIAEDAAIAVGLLRIAYPDAEVRMRETGRFIKLEVKGARPEDARSPLDIDLPRPWRIDDIAFIPDPIPGLGD